MRFKRAIIATIAAIAMAVAAFVIDSLVSPAAATAGCVAPKSGSSDVTCDWAGKPAGAVHLD